MPEIPAVSRRLVLGGTLATGALAVGIGTAGSASAAPAPTATSALANAGTPGRAAGQKSMINVPFEAYKTVRVGVIGLGNRGSGMTTGWSVIPGCVVTAVCDIRGDRVKRTADQLVAAGKPRPAEFGGSADSYAEMLKREDIDLVYIATPWEFHYEQGKAALLSGRHVVVELPIATELNELWDLVDTSERTRKNLMLSENCSYGRNELAMLKMGHEGLFGDITNGHGGYLHDLRALLFSNTYYTDSWRRTAHPLHRVLLRHARPGPDRGSHGHQPRRPHEDAEGHRDRTEGTRRLPGALRPQGPPVVERDLHQWRPRHLHD